MTKLIKLILFLSLFSLLLYGCQKDNNESNTMNNATPIPQAETGGTENNSLLEETDYFDAQAEIDQSLQKESEKGYSFQKPMVIVNPYGTSPLTAVVIFSTPEELRGIVTVEGKSAEDNISGEFSAEKNHIVPIYGLYAGDTTKVSLTLEDGASTSIEITTDSVDYSTEGFKAEMKEEAAYDYSRLTFVCDIAGYFTALDSKGDLRWFYKNCGVIGVKALSNGHLAAQTSYTIKQPYYQSGILEMDLLGKIYHEYAIPGGTHHDIYELADGNLLVASNQPDADTVEDYIVEIDRSTGNAVWELDMADLINPSEGGSINRTDQDWFHNNTVWYDEASDTLLISGRHVDAIVAVDKSEKTIKWILGNPDGWSEEYQKYFFTPVGDDFEWQYAQHQASMLSDGDILCFDNGAGRTKVTREADKVTGDDVYSRAVAFHIDEKNRTIEQVWEYGKELGREFYSSFISGAVSLNNDPEDIWITSGANFYNSGEDSYDYGPEAAYNPELVKSTNIIQVKDNKPVYQIKLNISTYRTLRLSPYKEAGAHDTAIKGEYLGTLGVSKTADANIDTANAQPAENCTVSLDPTKLTLSASYTIASADDLKDSYIVLRKEDGTILPYNTQQSTSEKDNGVTVITSGYISTEGLEGASYDVYVILGGKAYNTGYKIGL